MALQMLQARKRPRAALALIGLGAHRMAHWRVIMATDQKSGREGRTPCIAHKQTNDETKSRTRTLSSDDIPFPRFL